MMSGGYPYPFTSSPAQSSPWHSPVPYLFGGLAAMLGLIAFALLILACSYWKLSGYIDADDDDDNDRRSGERDLELGHPSSGDKPKFEEKVLVIMAGEEKPTFLATRISSVTSFAGRDSSGKEEGSGDPVQTGNMEIRETADQVP
ncbi:protein GLUTAMINE DUMPER 3-like [Diospyros lotus]|uniref:protein GLUTAMINE DUMPER 3-like n=1 Tax=Diospyros lotus TaxID=55363 RepID=UPI00224FA40A|nr:protein GLUTAMINE DUMPER 3-like [Diospyros lotus]